MLLNPAADTAFIWGNATLAQMNFVINNNLIPNTPNTFLIFPYGAPPGQGGVGIGLTTPQATLDVNGNIRAILPGPSANTANGTPLLYRTTSSATSSTGYIGYDVAEIFDTSEKIEAGDLLVINKNAYLKLRKSRRPYEKGIVGVASFAPAIVFKGQELEIAPSIKALTLKNQIPVALKGRVLCKVSLENGPIKPGDHLTSSRVRGHAMKATDEERFAGNIVGKALEEFHGGPRGEQTGIILILVNLQ